MNDLPLLNKRNGLPHAAKKIRTQPLRIAYIGGSNTVMKEGWRPRLHEWFNQTYPQSGGHTEINLSIGAIGTLAASFLIPENLRGQKPDLAVVEYSINDFNWMSWEGGYFGNELQTALTTSSSVEGLVRMIKWENPSCDVIFLHMPMRGQLLGNYKFVTDPIAEYEKLAGYYRIPSIFTPGGFRDLEASGTICRGDYEQTLFKDDAHLSPQGLDICMKFLTGSLSQLLEGTTQTVPVPAPMNRITTVDAKALPVLPHMIEGPYTIEQFKNSRFDLPYFSLPAGSRLKVRYTGVVVGIGSAFGPDTPGQYRGNIDGRETRLELYTNYCVKPHLGSIILNKDLSRINSNGVFTCEAMPQAPDYSRFKECTPVPLEQLRLNVTQLMILGDVIRPE